MHEVFRRYKEVAVDIVSLDRDQEEFFGVYAKIKKLEKTYFELAARVFDDYHELHLFMDSVYDQAKALEKGYEEKNK